MAVISCVCFCFIFLKKKNAGIKEHATAVGHPAENFQFKFVFFFIYNSFHASIISSVLGFSLGRIMFV